MRKIVLVGASIVFLCSSGVLQAATFNVTNTSELLTALSTAQDNNENDTINIAAGEYDASGATFTYLADNTGGSEENFSLEIVGVDRETTILDGGDLKRVLLITTSNLSGGDAGVVLTVRNLTIRNGNSSGSNTNGGGMLIDSDQASIVVDNCVFRENKTVSFGGGADLLANLGDVRVSNSLFIGNTALGDAGGAEFFGDGNVESFNNVFFGNTAGGVGGGAIIQFNGGDALGERLLVVNNTFISNDSGGDGGGLYIGIFDGAPERADIFNTILFGNTSAADGDDLFLDDVVGAEGAPVLLASSDIGNTASECDLQPACTPNITEQNNLNLDPGLVDPANGNFHLASDSPLIDQGSADAPLLPEFDFEGEARLQGGAPDIGADETVLCGDGIVAGDEDCDDGNAADGDCCDSNCQIESPDSACDDGDATTENDQCNVDGVCEGTPANNGGGCSLIR